MYMMICATLNYLVEVVDLMNVFEIISFIAEIVGLLSDLNELLTSYNDTYGIIALRHLRKKKEKSKGW